MKENSWKLGVLNFTLPCLMDSLKTLTVGDSLWIHGFTNNHFLKKSAQHFKFRPEHINICYGQNVCTGQDGDRKEKCFKNDSHG
jgi:hypothetical protein